MTLYDEINSAQVRDQFYKGTRNRLVRVYWYLDQGLDLLNKFKYLLGGIIALAALLRIEDSVRWMLTVFLIAVPILTLMGYFWVRCGVRVIEYLNLKLATHFGQYSMRLNENILQTLQEIRDKLK